MIYPDFDIIIKFDKPGVRYSFNGGERWLSTANKWNEVPVMIQHIINRYAIYNVLNPLAHTLSSVSIQQRSKQICKP